MKVRILVCALLVAAVLPSVSVTAQTANESTSSVVDTSQNARLQDNQQRYPTTLDDEEKARLQSICISVQEKIIVVRDRFLTAEEKREDTYNRIDIRLSALQKRLEAQNIDTSIVDLLLASYRKETAAFKAFAAEHQVNLNDTISMNCVEKPDVFRSQLIATQTTQQKLFDEGVRLKSMLSADLISSMEALKTKLQMGQES
jgi:hypothetical protein